MSCRTAREHGTLGGDRRAELSTWIAHYWSVHWDLRGYEPMAVETVPHPNVHFVVDDTDMTVNELYTPQFPTTLARKSQVFGVKFRPGGFRPFSGAAASAGKPDEAHLI